LFIHAEQVVIHCTVQLVDRPLIGGHIWHIKIHYWAVTTLLSDL